MRFGNRGQIPKSRPPGAETGNHRFEDIFNRKSYVSGRTAKSGNPGKESPGTEIVEFLKNPLILLRKLSIFTELLVQRRKTSENHCTVCNFSETAEIT